MRHNSLARILRAGLPRLGVNVRLMMRIRPDQFTARMA